MGGVIPDFPEIDIAAIEGSAKWCSEAGLYRVGPLSDRTRRTIEGVGKEQHAWDGEAGERWKVVVGARVADLDVVQGALMGMSSILDTLAKAVKTAKSDYYQAKARALYMDPGLRLAEVDPTFMPTTDQLARIRPMTEAILRADKAVQAAAIQLGDLGDDAGKITATWAASRMPGVPPGADRSQASLNLLTLLFGSLAHNAYYSSWSHGGEPWFSFVEDVLQDFRMPWNTTTIHDERFPFASKPDGMEGGRMQGWGRMVAVRWTRYQWATNDILQQLSVSQEKGMEYNLVLPRGATVSPALQQTFTNHPEADWYTVEGQNAKGQNIYRSGTTGKYYVTNKRGDFVETDDRPPDDKGPGDNNFPPSPPPPAVTGDEQPAPGVPGGGYAPGFPFEGPVPGRVPVIPRAPVLVPIPI